MKKYAGFRNGYVRVRIYGEQTERFLNLCRAREIRISDLRRESELSLTGCLQIRDFFRLAPIHRKTKVKIHILEKHGLPFFFYRSKKRKAFFLGLLLCAGLLLFLSGRLWEIDVEGNVRNSTPEILDFLEQKGIRHGMAKERLSCSEIAAEIRKKYPDITWVSAKLEGTRLLLTVREGIFIQTTEEKDKSACDIMAERDGEIIKMITRSGLPRKKVGDLCKKGEILVSGILELKDDSQEVVKYEAVHADADIYIQTENGMLGVGPKQLSGEAIIPNLINASRTPVTETPGCCYFDSATSFAMIRSGRMDATVIGAIQINEAGDLANWALPGKGVLGPGGAMDLVVGVKEVIVATSHTAKNGRHKLVKDCTVPLTGRKVVNTLVTEYAVFKFKDGMMFLLEHTSDVTLEEIAAMTSAHYELAEKISIREV